MNNRFELNMRKMKLTWGLATVPVTILAAASIYAAWSRAALVEDSVRRSIAVHNLEVMAVWIVGLIAVMAAAVALGIRGLKSIRIDESGVARSGLFKQEELKWSDVQHVKRRKNGVIRLAGPRATILVSTIVFMNPKAVVLFVDERLATLSKLG